MKPRLVAVLLLLALGLGLAAYRAAPSGPRPQATATPGPSPEPATWVGSRECVECHADEAKRWRGSHHALAMQDASEATVLGAFRGQTLTHQGQPATFLRDEAGFAVRAAGPDGQERVYRVTHAFGVAPLQQYLVELPGGRLQPFVWAWDTRPQEQGGQRWFHLEPAQARAPSDPLHWSRLEQNANHTCIECHVTGYELGYDLSEDRFQSQWAELGVACEACHGPGSNHVAWARDPQRSGGPRLFSLARGSAGGWVIPAEADTARWEGAPRRRDLAEGCYRCHGLRTTLTPRSEPGVAFLDQAMPRLLDAGLYHADGQIDAEVFVYGSFTQSKMHAAGVTCVDCHQPHDLSLRAEGNGLCAQCHRPSAFDVPAHHHHPAGSEGARCVNCHMPGKHYMVNDFRRDHRLAVPRPDLSVALGTPDVCAGCHQDQGRAWAAQAAAEWWPKLGERPSFAPALQAARAGHPQAGAALAALASEGAQPAIARATAMSLLVGNAPPPQVAAALQQGLGDESPLVRAAALRALEGLPPHLRWPLGQASLGDPVRAVRLEAARALLGLAPAEASASERERLERAQAELEAAERARPSRPESHVNLANLYQRQGRPQEAERELRTALRLDPRAVPALVNLADLYRAQEREAEALPLLQQAVEFEPDNPEAQHALGLGLIRAGQRGAALAPLRLAAELRPGAPRYAYVYALALQEAGQLGAARGALVSALRRRPGDGNLLWALVGVLRAQGDRAALRQIARELTRRYPRDPRVRQLLAELGE